MNTLTRKMTLLLIAVMCITFANFAQNMVTNPGFENWTDGKPDGWFGDRSNIPAASVVQYTSNVHGGSSACQLMNISSNNQRLTTKSISVVNGQTYTIKFWVRGHGDCRSGMWDGQGTGGDNYIYDPKVINVNSDAWAQQTFEVTSPVTADNAEFIILVRNTNADKDHLQFDDVEVTGGGAIPLIANFKADKTTAGAGTEIHFTDLSTGNPIQWEWKVIGPENFNSSEKNPSFTFNKTGSYDVKLIVSNATESDELTKADYITIGDFILIQDFNSGNFGDWETVSITGDQKWIISNNGGPDGSPCAQMNGYSGGNNLNEDWLISPSFTVSSFILTFDNTKNFNGDDLKLFVSDNYSGDVASATWTQLNFTLSTGNYKWVNSGNVKYTQQGNGNLNIAFKYTSSISDGALWRVDNIMIKDAGNQNIEEKPKTETQIYPNPSSTGIFTIKTVGNAAIKAYSADGSLIKTQTINNDTNLDLSTYPQGVYLLQITNENGVITSQKVVIK